MADDPNDPGLAELKRRLDELKRQQVDLERRIAARQGLPTADLIDSGTSGGFARKTPRLRWRIYCQLCERPNRIATRYPGGVPTICDECLEQHASPTADRVALHYIKQERPKRGLPPEGHGPAHEPRRED